MTWARFLTLARSKLRLCSANHRPGYWSNLPCDWPSTAWAYSDQEPETGPVFLCICNRHDIDHVLPKYSVVCTIRVKYQWQNWKLMCFKYAYVSQWQSRAWSVVVLFHDILNYVTELFCRNINTYLLLKLYSCHWQNGPWCISTRIALNFNHSLTYSLAKYPNQVKPDNYWWFFSIHAILIILVVSTLMLNIGQYSDSWLPGAEQYSDSWLPGAPCHKVIICQDVCKWTLWFPGYRLTGCLYRPIVVWVIMEVDSM